MEKGKLYLIPTYLSSTNNGDNITNAVKNVIRTTTYYLVENIRTARRYLSSLQLGLDIETIHFEPMINVLMNRHSLRYLSPYWLE
jgi:16S rRNA (cytidine1402-2'-O)-methyltransferase